MAKVKSEQAQNAKRGRPRKNGLHPPWMLGRAMTVIYEFHDARKSGLKYASAIQEAIAAVKRHDPQMRIGPTRRRLTAGDQGL